MVSEVFTFLPLVTLERCVKPWLAEFDIDCTVVTFAVDVAYTWAFLGVFDSSSKRLKSGCSGET